MQVHSQINKIVTQFRNINIYLQINNIQILIVTMTKISSLMRQNIWTLPANI